MATKARFFKAKLRDGHGEKDLIYAAPSKDSLLNNLDIPNTVKLVSTTHIGWRDVFAEPNEDMNGVKFTVKVKNRDLTVSPGDLGHEYLCQQFPQQVKNVQDAIDEYHNPEY